MDNDTPQAACNICGNSEFKPAPMGRLSRTGLPPVCTKCGSLERHRIIRQVWQYLGPGRLNTLQALQFSSDPSSNKSWFGEVEVSIYGKTNSMDMQNLPKEDASFDMVICNHVLEHIPDDRKAFREAMRVLRPNGLFQFSVPNPILRAETVDWGYPDEKQHDHFRVYGRDLVHRFLAEQPHAAIVGTIAVDPCTNTNDYVWFAAHSVQTIRAWLQGRLVGDLHTVMVKVESGPL